MGQEQSANNTQADTARKVHILTFLHAAKDGNTEKIAKYLDHKDFDVNTTNQRGNTALHIASIHGQIDVIELLLARGADINARCRHGYTPLYLAVMENHPAAVESLLTGGANKTLSPKGEMKDMTPLKVAETQEHEALVRLLRDPPETGVGPG